MPAWERMASASSYLAFQVSKSATVFVEIIRNIPLLVQIFFWLAVSQVFTQINEIEAGKYWFLVTARGISPPWLFPDQGFYQWLVFLVVGAGTAWYVHRRMARKQEAEGGETYAYTKAFGTLAAFALVGWFVHPVVAWDALEYTHATDGERLTLQTCLTYDDTAPRFIVIAEPLSGA